MRQPPPGCRPSHRRASWPLSTAAANTRPPFQDAFSCVAEACPAASSSDLVSPDIGGAPACRTVSISQPRVVFLLANSRGRDAKRESADAQGTRRSAAGAGSWPGRLFTAIDRLSAGDLRGTNPRRTPPIGTMLSLWRLGTGPIRRGVGCPGPASLPSQNRRLGGGSRASRAVEALALAALVAAGCRCRISRLHRDRREGRLLA